jgi:hypothetical protein
MIYKVGKYLAGVHVFGNRSLGYSNVEIFPAPAMLVFAFAVCAIACTTMWVIAKSQK